MEQPIKVAGATKEYKAAECKSLAAEKESKVPPRETRCAAACELSGAKADCDSRVA